MSGDRDIFVCRSCKDSTSNHTLIIKNLPALNKFYEFSVESRLEDFSLSYCKACGLIQQLNLATLDFVRPINSWISYNEPEIHLDDFIDVFGKSFNFTGRALGVGPFDYALLDRLSDKGMQTNCINLCINDSSGGYPYLETIQNNLQKDVLRKIIGSNELYDVISCRYILEHCSKPLESLRALSSFLSADGLLIIEIPDSEKFIKAQDYSFLWEEHVSYFVEKSIVKLVENAGMHIVDLKRYSGVLEDALLLVLRRGKSKSTKNKQELILLSNDVENYILSYSSHKLNYKNEIQDLCRNGGAVALIGIGHQALMFVHALDLKDYVNFYVDDNPNKIGTYPPGLNSSIISSEDFINKDTDLAACLVALNPSSLDKVLRKFELMRVKGVPFYSIFTASPEGSRLELIQ